MAHRRYPYKGVNLYVTTSIGLAEMHPNDSLDSLVGRADRGLYRAKQSGRDCVCVEPSGNSDVQ
ncbi:diguanylate cyclase [compost metagenome]